MTCGSSAGLHYIVANLSFARAQIYRQQLTSLNAAVAMLMILSIFLAALADSQDGGLIGFD